MKAGKLRITIALLAVICLLAGQTIGERAPWDCPGCGRKGNTGNFCGTCGAPAPEAGEDHQSTQNSAGQGAADTDEPDSTQTATQEDGNAAAPDEPEETEKPRELRKALVGMIWNAQTQKYEMMIDGSVFSWDTSFESAGTLLTALGFSPSQHDGQYNLMQGADADFNLWGYELGAYANVIFMAGANDQTQLVQVEIGCISDWGRKDPEGFIEETVRCCQMLEAAGFRFGDLRVYPSEAESRILAGNDLRASIRNLLENREDSYAFITVPVLRQGGNQASNAKIYICSGESSSGETYWETSLSFSTY